VPASRKVIITCAVTGAIHTPSMSPYLPVTPRQIEEAALSLEPATPDEARQMLDLKGRNAVSF
jgi:uncharacterized protein (DUF849 family)